MELIAAAKLAMLIKRHQLSDLQAAPAWEDQFFFFFLKWQWGWQSNSENHRYVLLIKG